MSDLAPRSEPRPRARGSLLHSPFFWAAVAGLILIPLLRPLLRREPAPPPVLGQLPEFRLVDAAGQPFGSQELAGRVWVANFIFTRCTSICPRLTAAMGRLARRYDQAGIRELQLVSITVDPAYDTPERLHEYGREHGVDPERWALLTGSEPEVRAIVAGGFKAGIGEPVPLGQGLIDIAHTGKFVLVDGHGRIRGYYDGDEAGLDEIFHRSQHVLAEQQAR